MDDEDVVFAVRDFIREQGESKYTILLTDHILFINHEIEINSYKVAQFVVKYLQENRPDTHERSTAEEINRSIHIAFNPLAFVTERNPRTTEKNMESDCEPGIG